MNDKIKNIVGALAGLFVLALFFYDSFKEAITQKSKSAERAEILESARKAKAEKNRLADIQENSENKEHEEVTEN